MGHNRRAEERERIDRLKAGRTHSVVITWNLHLGDWLVNFLEPKSRLPLSRQRVYGTAEPIRGMVDRSITKARGGPRHIIFTTGLQAGKGEIEVEISATQFHKLKR